MAFVKSITLDVGKKTKIGPHPSGQFSFTWDITRMRNQEHIHAFLNDPSVKKKLAFDHVTDLSINCHVMEGSMCANIVDIIDKRQLKFLSIENATITAKWFRRIMAALKRNPNVLVVVRDLRVTKREKKNFKKFFFRDMMGRDEFLKTYVGPQRATHGIKCSFDVCHEKIWRTRVYL